MCNMNFWCAITTIFIILIAARVLTNSVKVHVTDKHYGESDQQLKDFRTQAYKTKKDIEVLENFAEFNEQLGTRKRRQAGDLFDDLDDETDKEQLDEEQIPSNFTPDICNSRNCIHDNCRAAAGPSSKELINFLNNLKLENKNMPREIFPEESEPNNNAANGRPSHAEVGAKNLKQEEDGNSLHNEMNSQLENRQKRLKLKNGKKNDLQLRWSQKGEKNIFRDASNFKENPNFQKETQVHADLSSCQHCSQNKPKDISNDDCKSHKYNRPVVGFNNLKLSKETEKAEASRNFLKDFDRKDPKKDQIDNNAAEDEDDDEFNRIESLKLSSLQQPKAIDQYEFKQPALKTDKDQQDITADGAPVALNDQLEITRNNLSHEADYKLSKNEQNAEENKKESSWKWGLFKRSHPFNAMNEIKLKTSQRLMKKGFGPSLPSYSLEENQREFVIDNKLRQKEAEIFEYNNRNHKHFSGPSDIDNYFGESRDKVEKVEKTPVEPDLASLPRNDWYKIRYKRKTGNKSRYKRELNNIRSTKAFKKSFQMKNFKAKAVEVNGKLKNINKAVKTKQKFTKAITNAINMTQVQKIKKLKKAIKLQKNFLPPKNVQGRNEIVKNNKLNLRKENLAKSLSFRQNKNYSQTDKYLHYERPSAPKVNKLNITKAFNYRENKMKALQCGTIKEFKKDKKLKNKYETNKPNFGNKNLTKALSLEQNKTNDLKAKNDARYQTHFSRNETKLNITKAFSDVENKLKAFEALRHKKSINRFKRSLLLTNHQRQFLNNEQLPIFFIKRENAAINSDLSSHRVFKRTKRFNPCQTIDLIMYQKFHNGKAFKLKKLQNISNQTNTRLEKVRYRRALNINIYAKSAAGQANFIHKEAKIFLKKANQLLKNIGNLFKKSLKYFTFQKECSKEADNFKAFTTTKSLSFNKSLASRNNSNNMNSSQVFSYEALKLKAFENTNSHQKSLKSFPLENKATNIFRSLKRFKRSLEPTLQENQPQTDVNNHVKRRSYLFHYSDLYKADNQPDTSKPLASKLDINIDKEPKLAANVVLPVKQEINFENYYKTFDGKKFNDLKVYSPQSRNFDSLQLSNVWPETEPAIQNFKQQKRFLSTADNKSYPNKSNNNFRIPFKRDNDGESNKLQTKATKLPLKVQFLKDKYLKDLKNFNKNYKFITNNSSWPNNNNSTMDYSEKFDLQFNNEILNSKAFESLKDFIQSLPKNLTQPLLCGNLSSDQNEIDLNSLITTTEIPTTIRPLIPESTENAADCINNAVTTESSEQVTPPIEPEFEPPNEETEETSLEPIEEYIPTTLATDPENVKLNISINAQVHGNTKQQRFGGNASFSMTPGFLDERLRRDLNLSPLEKIPKHFLRLTSPETNVEDKEDLTDFISGKFSSNAIRNILDVVQENPHLKSLWPSLSPTQHFEATNQKHFYAIRNQQNEPQLHNSEKLLARAMSAISAIVEQQARSHSCVPLRPDLQAFYNMIRQSRQQQDFERQKRQNKKTCKKQNFDDELHLLDPNKIAEQTKIVKKLLKQYEELPKEDQKQVAVVRDDLLKNLLILRQLQDHEDQQENEWREKRENAWAASDEEVLKSLQGQYSEKFLKLLKAAELYREIKND